MYKPALQTLFDTCDRCIEIGGPTPDGYGFIAALGLRLPAHIIITNITNPVVLDPHGDTPQTYAIDEVVDITQPPYAPASVDMFLTSSFPRPLRQILIDQAAKTLRPGGVLVFENVLPEDEAHAVQRGFVPLLDAALADLHHSQVYQLKE